MNRIAATAWSLLAPLLLAGCTETVPDGHMGDDHMGDGHMDDGHHGTGGTGSTAGNLVIDGTEDVNVSVVAGQPEEFRFTPSAIEVREGQRVAILFTNNGTAAHEFDIRAVGFHLHAEPGETVSGAFVAAEEGVFEFACFLPGHYQAGMKGTLTVLPS